MIVENIFKQHLIKYTKDNDVLNYLWEEINSSYSSKNRYYHTLQHIENLIWELTSIKESINCWEAILFASYYHDIVYEVHQHNNEEKSAELAESHMKKLGVDNNIIELSISQILATKLHQKTSNSDINYFLDADLCVLGSSWETYLDYSQNIRKEYGIYSNEVYSAGRIKVLEHFIHKERIFTTEHFYKKYEKNALTNINREIQTLSLL